MPYINICAFSRTLRKSFAEADRFVLSFGNLRFPVFFVDDRTGQWNSKGTYYVRDGRRQWASSLVCFCCVYPCDRLLPHDRWRSSSAAEAAYQPFTGCKVDWQRQDRRLSSVPSTGVDRRRPPDFGPGWDRTKKETGLWKNRNHFL